MNVSDRNRKYCSILGADRIEEETSRSNRIEFNIKPKTRELKV